MELQIDIENLVRRLADALRQREERLLSELAARIIEEIGPTSDSMSAIGQNGDSEIMGIVPHKLYPVSFVAERWDVSADNVRKKSDEELPRSDWNGGEIRYRGIDILRYEGVEIDEHLDGSPSRARDSRGSRSPEIPQAKGRPSLPNGESGDERPYNGDLPALCDEESSPY